MCSTYSATDCYKYEVSRPSIKNSKQFYISSWSYLFKTHIQFVTLLGRPYMSNDHTSVRPQLHTTTILFTDDNKEAKTVKLEKLPQSFFIQISPACFPLPLKAACDFSRLDLFPYQNKTRNWFSGTRVRRMLSSPPPGHKKYICTYGVISSGKVLKTGWTESPQQRIKCYHWDR